MKLNASLLSGHASSPSERSYGQKLASRLEPGQCFRLVRGGSLRVLQTTSSSDGLRIRVATAEGTKNYSARQFAALDVVSPAMHRLASFVHRVLAYEAVIDDYVKEAIKHAGLPVDPTMNWASYLDALYSGVVGSLTKDPTIKEDAIRDLIVHELYEKRMLSQDSQYAHFDPDNAALAGKELDKKVSAYLIMLFKSRKREVADTVRRTLGIGSKGSLGLAPSYGMEQKSNEDGASDNTMADMALLGEGKTQGKEHAEFEGDNEVQEFLHGFKEMINDTQRGTTAKVLNIITDGFAEGLSRTEIRQAILDDGELMGRSGKKFDLDAYNYILGKWGQLVRAFARDPANGYSNSPIGRMIADEAMGEGKSKGRKLVTVSSLHTADMQDEGEVPAKPGQPMPPNQPMQPATPPPTSAIPPAPPATNPNVQQQQDSKEKTDDQAAAPKITIPPEIPGIHTSAKEPTMKTMSPEDRAKVAAKAKQKAESKEQARKITSRKSSAAVGKRAAPPYRVVITDAQRALLDSMPDHDYDAMRDALVYHNDGPLTRGEANDIVDAYLAEEFGKSIISSKKRFAAIRRIAEEDPKEVEVALSELAESFNGMALTLENLKDNLDLVDVPKEATIREKVAARNRYAASFRRLAEEAPEQLAEALNDFYAQLDDVVEGVENLADSFEVELIEPKDADESVVEEEITEDAPMSVAAAKGKRRELTVPERHQLAIARKTLTYDDAAVGFMGGPSKEEAREIIKRLTGKEPKESGKRSAVDHKDFATFAKYCWSFYGPKGLYGEFFDHNLTKPELIEAVRAQMATPNFEGDSIDREAVRDIMQANRHKPAEGKQAANEGKRAMGMDYRKCPLDSITPEYKGFSIHYNKVDRAFKAFNGEKETPIMRTTLEIRRYIDSYWDGRPDPPKTAGTKKAGWTTRGDYSYSSETMIDGKRVGVIHKKPSPGSYGYTAFIINGEQDELQWVEKKYGAEFAAKCKALPAYQEATAEPTWDKENNSWNKPKKIGAPNKTAEPNQPSVADSNGNRVMAGSTVQVVDHAGRLMYDETFRVVSVEKANFGTTWVTLDRTPPRHKSNKIQARFVSKVGSDKQATRISTSRTGKSRTGKSKTDSTYALTGLSFPWRANERNADLTSSELRRGYRVIGGDKGDVLFEGYMVDETGTELYRPVLRSDLELSPEEAHQIAQEVVEEAYNSIGTECVE